MAYLLNSIDLTTYGITAGHAPGSNIAVAGCFDMPKRKGTIFKEWAEDNTIESYTDSDEIFFEGRDIEFHGSIFGTDEVINEYLEALYSAVYAFTDLVTFSTPYGNFSVCVDNIIPVMVSGACSVVIRFREPVVTLTGGSAPATAANSNTIDGVPFSSYGLTILKSGGQHDLGESKDKYFTKYGAEGYQITKRKNRILSLNCLLIGSSISDFQDKVKALYLCFKSSGSRTIILDYEKEITCFAADGFSISNIYLYNNSMIGTLKINLLCETIGEYLFKDWFLPSKDELNQMYVNLKAKGLGGFADDWYSHSSESSATAIIAQNFTDGTVLPKTKGATLRVRACRTFTALAGAYIIGGTGQSAGLIFYISGTTYYEAASSDQSAGKAWSNITDAAIGTTGTAIGTGQANTTAIIAQEGHTDSAAKLCNDLEL